MGKSSFHRFSTSGQKPPVETSTGVTVADALFTTTQQRVLALLFGQPERSFFTKELIDLAEGGSGAVQRELIRFHRSGLIAQTRVGNQKHYKASAASPVFEELCSIVSKMLGPEEVLRDALRPLADTVPLALLYGSVAKRRDTALSDIDVLLVSDTLTLEQAYEALMPAETRLRRSINPTLYTETEFRSRLAKGNPFLIKLLDGKLMTLLGNKDEFIATG